MEHTNGLGRKAEVWLGGRLLCVCDGVSKLEQRCDLGPVDGAKFSYMTAEGVSWAQATRGNPAHRLQMDPVSGWQYMGFGRVMSIAPVVVDFGLLIMEDANWTTDESLIGRYVRIPIDRLELNPAPAQDWPDNMK